MSSSETAPLLSTDEPGVLGPIHLPLPDHDGDISAADSPSDPRDDRYLVARIGHWINLFLAPTVAALGITVQAKYNGNHPVYYELAWAIRGEIYSVIFWVRKRWLSELRFLFFFFLP